MSLSEKTFTLAAAASADERVNQYTDFVENVLGAEITLHKDDDGYYWFDEYRSIGFKFGFEQSGSSYSPRVWFKNASGSKAAKNLYTSDFNYNKAVTINYMFSKAKSVLYVYMDNGTRYNYDGFMIFAQDEGGMWEAFFGVNSQLKMLSPEGLWDMQKLTSVYHNQPFTACKMPEFAGNRGMLKEICKIIIPCKVGTNANMLGTTIINFSGEPYKAAAVVPSNTYSSSDFVADFAFPVDPSPDPDIEED